MTEPAVTVIPETIVDGHRLGRHVEHDPRSLAFAEEDVAAAAIKSVKHTRLGGPFDQGQIGSCTGNAAAGILNTKYFHKPGSKLMVEADALSIYEAATIIDGVPGQYPPDDTGSSGLAVCKVLLTEKRIAKYTHALSINGALGALQRNAVITGVNWYESFDTPDADGMIVIGGQIRGGHEFELLEFELAATNDPILDGILEAENSWSAQWGLKGRFRFTARTWATLLEQQGDVTCPQPLVA